MNKTNRRIKRLMSEIRAYKYCFNMVDKSKYLKGDRWIKPRFLGKIGKRIELRDAEIKKLKKTKEYLCQTKE